MKMKQSNMKKVHEQVPLIQGSNTLPHVESTDDVESTNDKDDNEEVQGVNIEGKEIYEESNSKESEGNELYMDLNVNLEGRDVEMTDAQPTNVQTTQVTEDTHLQSERLRDEAQAENADFLNKLDDNIKKIFKDPVKEQVKAQVSKILPKIKKTINEQLEAEVMTRSSTESKTYLALAANLSELHLKKILIDKMESNKSIHRSDEQKNLYKTLVNAYESEKLILDTYRDTVSFN
ncbi:hypothetical protein Tco_0817477 [Tanacetum coccineum]